MEKLTTGTSAAEIELLSRLNATVMSGGSTRVSPYSQSAVAAPNTAEIVMIAVQEESLARVFLILPCCRKYSFQVFYSVWQEACKGSTIKTEALWFVIRIGFIMARPS